MIHFLKFFVVFLTLIFTHLESIGQCNFPEGTEDISEFENTTILSIEDSPVLDSLDGNYFYKYSLGYCIESSSLSSYADDIYKIHLRKDLVEFDLFEYDILENLTIWEENYFETYDTLIITDTIYDNYWTVELHYLSKYVYDRTCISIDFNTSEELHETLPDSSAVFIEHLRSQDEYWNGQMIVDTLIQVGICATWDDSYLGYDFDCTIEEGSENLNLEPYNLDSILLDNTNIDLYNSNRVDFEYVFINTTGEVLLDLTIDWIGLKDHTFQNSVQLDALNVEANTDVLFCYENFRGTTLSFNYVFPNDTIILNLKASRRTIIPLPTEQLYLNFTAHGFPDNQFTVYQGCAQYQFAGNYVLDLNEVTINAMYNEEDQRVDISSSVFGDTQDDLYLERISDSQQWEELGMFNQGFYYDKSIQFGKTYYYRARQDLVTESYYSDIVSVFTPTSVDRINVSLSGYLENTSQFGMTLRIYNTSGQVIDNVKVDEKETVQLSLPNGTYFAQNIEDGSTLKFVIMN